MNEGIRLYDLGINYSDNGVDFFFKRLARYLFKQIRHRRRLRALIDAIKPDAVVSMFGDKALLIAGMHIKAPKIIESHFCKMKYILYRREGLWHFFDLFRTRLDAYIAKKYDRFVVLTKEDAIDLRLRIWMKSTRPMVLLESQSYGIPAVSFTCKCGPRDIIEDGMNYSRIWRICKS